MNKRQKLLDEMISIYIRDGEPIGSESLRLMMDIKISSATIRNYFKVLVDEGILFQPHISSGRIPTNNTLKSYWRKNIDISDILFINDINKINFASNKYKVFCNVKTSQKQILQDVINYKGKYIVLIFNRYETIIPYTKRLFYFIKELINQDIEDIKALIKSVGVNDLFNRLEHNSYSQVFNFGYQFLNHISNGDLILEIINGLIYYRLNNGFCFDLFPDGYLGLIRNIKFNNNDGKMFIFGKLLCNYREFYQEIAS